MLMTQVLADCYGCEASIEDADALMAAAMAAAEAVGATVVGESTVRYVPHGLTIAVFLAESHIVLTTWPDPLPGAPRNKSIEALASLPDGSLLAISEGQHVGTNRVVAARVTRDAVTPCLYETAEGFEPTGADRVGNLLFVVERRLSFLGGFETRVATVDLPAVWTPGTVLKSREIARFGGADPVAENYEGIAASQEAGGGYRLLLVSDDNFTSLQRSLLLDLVWRPDGKVARAP